MVLDLPTCLSFGSPNPHSVAKVDELLDYAAPFIQEGTVCLFLKSGGAQEEVERASRSRTMRATYTPSITDPRGVVLRLEDIRDV